MTSYTPEAIEAALRAYCDNHGTPEDMIVAILAAADAAMEAAGFVRVPVEPTEAMCMAGYVAVPIGDGRCDNKRELARYDTLGRYRAMIAARPTTPQDKA